jgi:hypothetical protein
MTYAAVRVLSVLGLTHSVKLPWITRGLPADRGVPAKEVSEPAIPRSTIGFPDVLASLGRRVPTRAEKGA